ncbi:hypothetical protein OROGR_017336 [Orobanche gracilis]
MDFDEYDYLEKAVEETNGAAKEAPGSKKERDRSEKGYRKRERTEDDVFDEEERERKSSSKKSRSEENGRGREKERSRDRDRERSSRHRSRDRDADRERRRSRDNEKDKDRDRERERRERDKEKEREKEREREREREREKDRDRSRRSRSHSRLEREREREFMREREREESSMDCLHLNGLTMRKPLEGTQESGFPYIGFDKLRFKDKKEAVEPEADPERDQRTVFAYQMPLKATERDVFEFFSKVGKVRDVKLIMDRNSRRSKGVGYIEFYDAMSVPMAIALCGHPFLGQPVMVKPSEAEKNLVQSNTSGGGSGVTGPYGATDRKLYVGNLHFNMTEAQLKQIFGAFGEVELVQLPTDPETGFCKGFGFVQFLHVEHAKAAQILNGKLEIAGRSIKVSCVTDHVGAQDCGTKTADFDDDDGGGLALNAQSRAMLMAKLDRSGNASSVMGPIGVPAMNGTVSAQQAMPIPMPMSVPIPMPMSMPMPMNAAAILPNPYFPAPEPIGTPSECLLLKNMFDPATEVDPEFDLDIGEDVEEECSKYGRVKHIYVDKNSAGYVYLRFDSVEAASHAQQAMHKRWFARRLISAIFLQPHEYDAKFKGTA